MFESTDKDMNGHLDPNELREAIDTVLQLTLNDAEFNKLVLSMVTRADGSVTLKKFKKYFKSVKTIKHGVIAGRQTFTTLNIQIIDGPHKGKMIKEYYLKDSFQISIGNDEECDILLDQDPEISGEHGSICWDKNQSLLLYVDQDSTNGSRVNDTGVAPNVSIMLSLNDTIKVGTSCLVVVMDSAKEIPSSTEAMPADKSTSRNSDPSVQGASVIQGTLVQGTPVQGQLVQGTLVQGALQPVSSTNGLFR